MPQKEILDQFKSAQDSLVIQQSDFSLAAIFNMVQGNAIDITPHYQRRDRWVPDKQSALIESFLLNVPVPPVYLSEDEYGLYSVIDGKQRITAVCDFLAGKLKLRSLTKFPELNGMSFSDLPSQLQNALTVRPYIRVTTLLKQSNESLKYEVFLRLNTGGESLRAQEVRNVAYSGTFNDLLFSLSKNSFLRTSLKITSDKSPAYKIMDDIEHVLRFFTVRARWKKMSTKLGEEMDFFMAEHRYSPDSNFKDVFTRAIKGCEAIWGKHAFQKPIIGGWREQLISPLYDAEMVAVSLLSPQSIAKIATRREAVLKATRQAFDVDADFLKAVSQSTNNPSAIRKRVSAVIDLLNEVQKG